MRAAEHQIDGLMERQGGANDKTGKRRGPYKIGGDSKQSAQRKRQKIRHKAKVKGQTVPEHKLETPRFGSLSLMEMEGEESESELMEELRIQREEEESDGEEGDNERESEEEGEESEREVIEGDNKRAREEDREESTTEGEGIKETPMKEVDASEMRDDPEEVEKVQEAEQVAEWVEGVLDDAAPKSPLELQILAEKGHTKARKDKDYRSEILFASLVNFYKWMPLQGRLRASLRIARNHQRGPAFARVLCEQARFFKGNGCLKPSHQGQREQGYLMLDDEAFSMGVQRWPRTLKPGEVNPKLLQQHVNETLLPSLKLRKKTVSVRQAQHWLWRLGYHRKWHSKGVYYDGHEQKDVKQWQQVFLTEMNDIERFRAVYEGNEMAEKSPTLSSGDDYWNMDQMIEQMRNALKIACRLFPNAVIHWVFDNSSCHGSFAKDALTVAKMNVNPGGKNVPHMHDTIIPTNNPFERGRHPQSMEFPETLPTNHPHKQHAGLSKGMAVVLEERGYPICAKKIIGECKGCKAHKARKPHLTEDELLDDETETEDEDDRPVDCCQRHILSLQEDFQGEKSLLEKDAGDICHFLPKFHLEMNPIEYHWGWAKRYFRERSNGNFARAKVLVQEALDSCPLIMIHRFFRRAGCYMSVYSLGATGLVAEYAVKKYHSHRAVRQVEIEKATLEWKACEMKGK
ncbi:hypothetical protein JAAARDRAFT_45287 [Jaapia argillacea MUCL 33604]|uniref:Uncharacterized protein n=1 Tax=Jaapia argillacea MUCL 33604 TaxID=933084 RepID=A0A067Q6J3_9AGAM|nr:hypothetical protein JAAARDRAFT_45287 [Jaapia argillacea MUCL 33604]